MFNGGVGGGGGGGRLEGFYDNRQVPTDKEVTLYLMSLNSRAFSRLSSRAIRNSAKSFMLLLLLYCERGEKTMPQTWCTSS